MSSEGLTAPSHEEYELLRELERITRELSDYVKHHSEGWRARGSTLQPFAPRTVSAVEEMRPLLKRLDELRPGEEQKPAA